MYIYDVWQLYNQIHIPVVCVHPRTQNYARLVRYSPPKNGNSKKKKWWICMNMYTCMLICIYIHKHIYINTYVHKIHIYT